MSSFASLRKKQGNGLDTLRDKFKKLNNTGGGRNPTLEDETFLDIKHVRGKDGTGEMLLRLLPAGPNEDDPILKIEEYNWKGPNGYYINLSRRTLGANEADPAYEYNGSLFANKSLTKDERFSMLVNRRESYVVLVKVLEDENKPDNVGKIFKWKVGPQIYKIINGALFPEFAKDKPINVFDPEEGADFVLRVITKQIPDSKTGQLTDVPSYEKSKFNAPSVYMSADEFDEEWQTLPALKDIITPDKFKSYDELKVDLDRALGRGDFAKNEDGEDAPKREVAKPKETKAKSEKTAPKKEEAPIDDDIPFEFPEKTVDETPEETSPEPASDDIDDWLNSIKK